MSTPLALNGQSPANSLSRSQLDSSPGNSDKGGPDQRPVNVAFRADIEWTEHTQQQRWVAHDPLNGRFFYFSRLEYEAAGLLDGRRTLLEILQRLQSAHPAARLNAQWLTGLLRRLHASQLLLPQSTESVETLLRQHAYTGRQSWLQLLLSPLSIRIPLFNPQAILELMKPLALVLFHRFVVVSMLVFGCLANLSVLGQLLADPNSLKFDLSLLQGDRWMWLLACYVVVKSLHELGHGLACVYFGTKCSELGLLFLFFTPCMYCDTTDAWRIGSRWKRAAIGAAGMYVELILASIAAVTWLITQDGLLHSLAANVMIVCSVGTLLINGNPFLRYDGYYILSDIWGVPNLSDQAREATMIAFTQLMTGQRVDASHLDRPVWMLTTFQAFAVVYRTFIMFMVLWLVWSLLVPIGLGLFALLIMFGTVVGLVLAIVRTGRMCYAQVVTNEALKFTRVVALFVCLLLFAFFVSQVELPVCIQSRGVTDFSDKVPVFATENATLLRAAPLGSLVPANGTLVEFDAPDKRYELQLLQNEVVVLQKKIEFLNQLASIDASTSFELPLTEELLNDRRSRIQLLQRQLEYLVQAANKPGRLLPTATSLKEPLAAPADLHWHGSPLAEISRGCMVERGTLLGWFTNQEKMEVVAIVSQQDIKQLRVGMVAACRWDCQVGQIITGKIVRIAPDPIEQTPDELIGDPTLISLRNAAGRFAPVEPHYAVTIEIADPALDRVRGSLVTVQVHVKSEPLIQTLIHLVRVSLKNHP